MFAANFFNYIYLNPSLQTTLERAEALVEVERLESVTLVKDSGYGSLHNIIRKYYYFIILILNYNIIYVDKFRRFDKKIQYTV